jgi:hypothetical protein
MHPKKRTSHLLAMFGNSWHAIAHGYQKSTKEEKGNKEEGLAARDLSLDIRQIAGAYPRAKSAR